MSCNEGGGGSYKYEGNELDVFSAAVKWKGYWAQKINKYVEGVVLEVGAGIGSNTVLLKNCRVSKWVALEPDCDLCARMRADFKNKFNILDVDVFSCDLSEFRGSDLSFDTILYLDVLEHIKDDKEELRAASGFLKLGGKIVILAPAHNFLYSPFDRRIGHYRRYNKSMLNNITPDGFKVIDIKYLDSVGFFASLVNKVFLRESEPSLLSILFWDRCLVRASMFFDVFFQYFFGRSILVVMEKSR